MTRRLHGLVRRRHRGVATIWLLAGLPALLALFLFLLELGHLWAARVELESSLEAAALAAAKDWGTTAGSPAIGWSTTARLRGQALTAANSINGNPVLIGTNLGTFNVATNPNENSAYVPAPGQIGNLVFGAVTEIGPTVTFDADSAPACGGPLLFAVRAQGTISVPSLFGAYFGALYGTHNVTVDATAIYDCVTSRARLVRVDSYVHP